MPRTKKASNEESPIEKAEKSVKKTIKKIENEVEEVKEEISDKVKEIAEELTNEKAKKKTKKKAQKSEEEDKTAKSSSQEEKEKRLAKIKEKAKELESKLETKEIDFIKEVKAEGEKAETLVPIEDYLKSSIHLGTRAITPDMRQFVYKRRADSLAVFNTALLDKKIKEGAEFLAKYAPEDIVLVCKREAGVKAAELFSKVTGISVFAKKYPPGILTNPHLENFLETELVFVCDPWTDKAAMDDAIRIKLPVIAICDTNNYTQGVNVIIPGNNKSAKSLGMIFYLLAKLYTEKRKIKVNIPPISEWIDGWESLIPPK